MDYEQLHLLVATGKGLIVYKKVNDKFIFKEDFFRGLPVSIIYVDENTGTWWVALAHKHWGQKIHFSNNKGKSWEEVEAPRYPESAEITPGVKATLKYIWSIQAGGKDQQGHLYVGTEPGGLFHSPDSGKTFSLVESLWEHPSRPEHWFGGGRNYAGIHSIVMDPENSNHFYVGISCAGVFETFNGGKSWKVKNKGLKADYLPDPHPEVGHDPHMILLCKSNPQILWQQNHCGVYKSEDAGASWKDVSNKEKGIYYGFALAVDHTNPDKAWIIPATSDQMRIPVNKSLIVCRTDDGGESWETLKNGLPQSNFYGIVLRHAFDRSQKTLAFGTNNGNLYYTLDDGDSWELLSHGLAPVYCIRFSD